MQSKIELKNSSQGNREISDPNEIQDALDLARKFDWQFDYLVLSGKKISSYSADLTSVNEAPDTFTVVGDFSNLNSCNTKAVHFRAVSGGLSSVFQCELVDCIDFFTQKECKFRFPQMIRFSQQRAAVRIDFTTLQNIPVNFYSKTNELFTGNVVDLSETGAKIKFSGKLLDSLKPSEIIDDCKLLLPDEFIIDSRVQIMGCVYDRESDSSHLRCQFLQLHDNSELQLRQFIYQYLSESGN